MSADTAPAIVSRDRREAPRRYPLIGFGFIAAFVLVSYGGEIRKGGLHSLSTVEADSSGGGAVVETVPSRSIEAALVESAKVLRGVECLQGARLPLEPDCRAESSAAIKRFMAMVKTEITARASQSSPKARAIRPIAIQLNLMMVSILPKVQMTGSIDRAADMSISALATSAKRYVDQVDTAYNLSDPKWKSTEVAADDISSPPAAPAEPAPTPAAQPAPKVDAPAHDAPAVAKKPENAPDEVEHDPALIASLVKGIADAQKTFVIAGHDPNRLQDAIQATKPTLEDVDAHLQQYRATPHGDDAAQQKAAAFVSTVDQARGHILRAIIEFQHASLDAPQDQEGTFRKADDLLDKAGDDVKSAQELSKTAP